MLKKICILILCGLLVTSNKAAGDVQDKLICTGIAVAGVVAICCGVRGIFTYGTQAKRSSKLLYLVNFISLGLQDGSVAERYKTLSDADKAELKKLFGGESSDHIQALQNIGKLIKELQITNDTSRKWKTLSELAVWGGLFCCIAVPFWFAAKEN